MPGMVHPINVFNNYVIAGDNGVLGIPELLPRTNSLLLEGETKGGRPLEVDATFCFVESAPGVKRGRIPIPPGCTVFAGLIQITPIRTFRPVFSSAQVAAKNYNSYPKSIV